MCVALLVCTAAAAHKVNTANTNLEHIIFWLGITSLTHVQYVSNHSSLKVTEQHTVQSYVYTFILLLY